MTTRTSRTTVERGGRTALALSLPLTLVLALSACGDETEPSAGSTAPPATTTSAPATTAAEAATETETETGEETTEAVTDEPAQTTSAQATAEETTSEEPAQETTAAQPPAGSTTDLWAPAEDDGDDTNGAESGPEIDRTQEYLLAVVDGQYEAAAGMLSEESRGLLEADDPAALGQEVWVPELVEHLTSEDAREHGIMWAAYPAWAGADETTRVVTVRGIGPGDDAFYYAFGAREVDGEWVVDQDRVDTPTGAPWVDFTNPAWQEPVREDEPLAFRVAAEPAAHADVTFRLNGWAEPRAVEAAADGSGTHYAEPEVTYGMPGGYVGLVTGRTVGDPLEGMVRAHTVTFGIGENDG